MNNEFQLVPAAKTQRKARIAVIGPAGCGKTMTSLLLARGLAGDKGRIGVVDTEHGSASLYSRVVAFDKIEFKPPFTPARYSAAVKAVSAAGYDVLICDSMSQEWNGEGGVLQMVEANKARIRNDFAAWNGPSQEHEAFIQTVVGLPMHVISTFRSKTEYSLVTENGRTKVEKLGMGAITRDQAEYEYDLVLEMTLDHKAVVTKSRISEFADQVITKPDSETGAKLRAWLDDGAPEATLTPDSPAKAPSAGRATAAGAAPIEPPTPSAPKTGYIDTAPTKALSIKGKPIEGTERIADVTLELIADYGRRASEEVRKKFYDEWMAARGFTGDTYGKQWRAFVERGTLKDAGDAIEFLGTAAVPV